MLRRLGLYGVGGALRRVSRVLEALGGRTQHQHFRSNPAHGAPATKPHSLSPSCKLALATSDNHFDGSTSPALYRCSRIVWRETAAGFELPFLVREADGASRPGRASRGPVLCEGVPNLLRWHRRGATEGERAIGVPPRRRGRSAATIPTTTNAEAGASYCGLGGRGGLMPLPPPLLQGSSAVREDGGKGAALYPDIMQSERLRFGGGGVPRNVLL